MRKLLRNAVLKSSDRIRGVTSYSGSASPRQIDAPLGLAKAGMVVQRGELGAHGRIYHLRVPLVDGPLEPGEGVRIVAGLRVEPRDHQR
jgi:hypothetical protein